MIRLPNHLWKDYPTIWNLDSLRHSDSTAHQNAVKTREVLVGAEGVDLHVSTALVHNPRG